MNSSENGVRRILEEQGYTTLNSGYPDFLVVHPSGAICFIEVKHGSDKVRKNQKTMHKALKKASIPVYVWKYPDDNKKYSKVKFMDKELVKLINYEYIRDWTLSLHQTLHSALRLQRILYELFAHKDADMHIAGISKHRQKQIFDWDQIWSDCDKVITKDARYLYEQLKTMWKVSLDMRKPNSMFSKIAKGEIPK